MPMGSAAEGWEQGDWAADAPPSPQELVSKLLHLHFKDDKTKGV